MALDAKINQERINIKMFLSRCPLCASPNTHQTEGTVERKIYGEFMIVPSVKYWISLDCGEKIFLPEAMRIMENFIKQNEKRLYW